MSLFSVRALALISAVLMQGCISEQQYRLDQQDHADQVATAKATHAAQLQEAEQAADHRARIAAADAATATALRLADAHRDALALHRQQTAADAAKLVADATDALTALVAGVRADLVAHMDAVARSNAAREQEELRHDIQTRETLKGYQSRLDALETRLVSNLADDLNDGERRTAALERLTAAETKLSRAELDVVDLRRKLGTAEDKTEIVKEDASDANTKAIASAVVAFLAVLGGVLNEWRKSRAAKKA